jgi:hypothetical protein
VAQGVVDEGEGLSLWPGSPARGRHAGEVDGEGVLVDAVEAALGDQAAGVDGGRSGLWATVASSPSRVQAATTWSARKRQVSTRKAPEPMAGSQTLRLEQLGGGGLRPGPRDEGSRVRLDDRLGEAPGGVVASWCGGALCRVGARGGRRPCASPCFGRAGSRGFEMASSSVAPLQRGGQRGGLGLVQAHSCPAARLRVRRVFFRAEQLGGADPDAASCRLCRQTAGPAGGSTW